MAIRAPDGANKGGGGRGSYILCVFYQSFLVACLIWVNYLHFDVSLRFSIEIATRCPKNVASRIQVFHITNNNSSGNFRSLNYVGNFFLAPCLPHYHPRDPS